MFDRKKLKSHVMSIKVDTEIMGKLNKYCEKTGLTKAAAIRNFIKEALENEKK